LGRLYAPFEPHHSAGRSRAELLPIRCLIADRVSPLLGHRLQAKSARHELSVGQTSGALLSFFAPLGRWPSHGLARELIEMVGAVGTERLCLLARQSAFKLDVR